MPVSFYGGGQQGAGTKFIRRYIAPSPGICPPAGAGNYAPLTKGLVWPRRLRVSSAAGGDTAPPTVAQSFRNYVLSLSPRLFMRMTDVTTDLTPRAKDDSDYANHGTLYGSLAPGNIAGLLVGDTDKAADFDGSNDRIGIGVGVGLQLQAFTLSALVKAVSGQAMRIITYESSDSASIARGYLLQVSTGLIPSFTAGGNGVGAYQGINAGVVLTAGTIYQITATFDSGLQKIYVNGVLSASGQNGSGSVSYTNATGLNIGYQAFNGPTFSRGVHDEVIIVPFALNDAQVLALYNKAVGLG